ncbi:hypothetical protein LCGC14_2521270 [marine sediment metagenome]|uniref:Uncharacterized protein n=1 Tax=marine sediment metagenome TaxID=412755 RepID=A0A0F9BJA5_9ZZZZ
MAITAFSLEFFIALRLMPCAVRRSFIALHLTPCAVRRSFIAVRRFFIALSLF